MIFIFGTGVLANKSGWKEKLLNNPESSEWNVMGITSWGYEKF